MSSPTAEHISITFEIFSFRLQLYSVITVIYTSLGRLLSKLHSDSDEMRYTSSIDVVSICRTLTKVCHSGYRMEKSCDYDIKKFSVMIPVSLGFTIMSGMINFP